MLKKGYIQVYTGNGKGKTTAALGLALRAAGRGLRTYIGQFMKGQPSGELKALEALDGRVIVKQYGRSAPVHLSVSPGAQDISLAQRGLDRAAEAMRSEQYDIIVLDEVTVALRFGLLTVEALVDFIKLADHRDGRSGDRDAGGEALLPEWSRSQRGNRTIVVTVVTGDGSERRLWSSDCPKVHSWILAPMLILLGYLLR